jgi:hypothetical protein
MLFRKMDSSKNDALPYYNIFVENVKYDTNIEYRTCLQTLCNLRFPEGDFPEDIPPEYRNEMSYDIDSMTLALDFVYKKTKTHPLFQKLYSLGAAQFFTEDDTVGLAIMFSYDYLKYFHPCFTYFLKSPDEFNENMDIYKNLIEELAK